MRTDSQECNATAGRVVACLIAGAMFSLGIQARADCPPQGDAKTQHQQRINVIKNRTDVPQTFDNAVSLAAMLQPGDDRLRWKNYVGAGATIAGYCIAVGAGGIETANCHATDPAGQDTHIAIAPYKGAPKTKWVIVEVTPRTRSAFGIGTTQEIAHQFLGQFVKVDGWLFFDEDHLLDSVNTNPRGKKLWRATAWELHPVTKIEVLK